jgi:hypothetical protein
MTEDSPDEMNRAMRKHVLHMMQEFANEGHSGFSASYAISILTKLLDFKPLSPLTGADDEWVNVREHGGEIHYQNKRKSSVFKDADGSVYDIEGKVFWEWARSHDDDGNLTDEAHKSYYTCRESSVPVTFPYVVPEKPIYEYRHSDAEPQQPPQNEEGFL